MKIDYREGWISDVPSGVILEILIGISGKYGDMTWFPRLAKCVRCSKRVGRCVNIDSMSLQKPRLSEQIEVR